jgi:hypothetical protein
MRKLSINISDGKECIRVGGALMGDLVRFGHLETRFGELKELFLRPRARVVVVPTIARETNVRVQALTD